MVRIGRNWVATTLIPVTHRTNTITVKVPALSPTMVKPMVILIFGSCGVPSALTSYHKVKKCILIYKPAKYSMSIKAMLKPDTIFKIVISKLWILWVASFLLYSLIKKNNEEFWGWRGSGTKVYRKTQLTINGQDFNWAISSDDVKTRFGENGKQAVKFYKRDTYITDCTLH